MKRRNFLKSATVVGSAFCIVPSFVLGKDHVPPSDTLYIAAFGCGGRGEGVIGDLGKLPNVKFVAMCDVDDRSSKNVYSKYPDVIKYKDFRKLYERHIKEIDAIMVATPDHTHATIALPFMRSGKHAYVEKPLTHNINEARLMAQEAKKHKLVTQMGNQGSSSHGIRQTKQWIDAGVIGDIQHVDCWTNRSVWLQGFRNSLAKQTVPDELDWNLWLGPSQMRAYNESYLPFKWRGWWDFGTGALGDMGCHIMETPFNTLELGHPTEAEASCTNMWTGDFVEAKYDKTYPSSSIVRLKFESKKRGNISLDWYDGGLMPKTLEGYKDTSQDQSGRTIFYGTQGTMMCDTYSRNPRIIKGNNKGIRPPQPLNKIVGGVNGHTRNWIEGCIKGTPTSSPFSYAGPLTEAVLMGNLAIRSYQYKELKAGKTITDWESYNYPGRQKLLWDGAKMNVTNLPMANQWVSREYRKGWGL